MYREVADLKKAEETAYWRECDAREALVAWRPASLVEAATVVCEVNRIERNTEGGWQVGLNDLATMLSPVVAVA